MRWNEIKGLTDPAADLKVDEEKMDTQENDSVRQRRLRQRNVFQQALEESHKEIQESRSAADLKEDEEKMDTQENDSVRQRRLRHDGNQVLNPICVERSRNRVIECGTFLKKWIQFQKPKWINKKFNQELTFSPDQRWPKSLHQHDCIHTKAPQFSWPRLI